MGFFKKLKKGLKTFIGMQTLPLTPVGATIKSVKGYFVEPKKQIAKEITKAGLVLGAMTPIGQTILMSAIKRPVKTITTILTATTLGTVLVKSPKVRKAGKKIVTGAPTLAVTGGKIIAETIETGKPPVSPKKALITGGVLAGVVVGGLVVKKGVEKVRAKTLEIPPTLSTSEEQLIPEKSIGIEGEIPVTPETTTITTGEKPYKEPTAKKRPSIRQSVRVNIDSRSKATGIKISKRYLNQEILC